jgi:hypothetical protein
MRVDPHVKVYRASLFREFASVSKEIVKDLLQAPSIRLDDFGQMESIGRYDTNSILDRSFSCLE